MVINEITKDEEGLMIYLAASMGEKIDTLDEDAQKFAQIAVKNLIQHYDPSPEKIGIIGDVNSITYFLGIYIQKYLLYLSLKD